jgi:hypothetical protein
MVNNDTATYDRMYIQMLTGVISKESWVEYCTGLMAMILEQNKDVFVRLKHR